MEENKKYMELAIEAAKESQKDGGVAIGAVLVDNSSGKVIASGGSIVHLTHDPTSHAEINCIRSACRKIHTDDLYNYTLFSTLEPCHMCLSTAAWAKIQKVIFGAYRKDVDPSLFDIKGDFSDEREARKMNLRESYPMEAHGGILEKECASLLGNYHDLAKHTQLNPI